MKLHHSVLAGAVAIGAISGACSTTPGNSSGTGGGSSNGGGIGTGGGSASGGSSSSSGGATGNGGSVGASGSTGTTGGGGGVCTNVTPCGGSVVGTWNVTSSCLKISGNLDVSGFGIGCTTVGVTGSLQVTGSFTAKADGSYSDNTTTSGMEQLTVAAGCLNVSGTVTTCDRLTGPLQALGFSSLTCASAADGGCSCSGTVNQKGGNGLVSSDPQTSGGYTTPNNVFTTDTSAKYSYCVSGNTLTWTPQSPTETGTIVFSGSGAAGGAGGTTGAGGATSSGGSNVTSGGAGGSAGMPASGGTSSSGGATSDGGKSQTGGSAGASSGGQGGSKSTGGAGGATATGGAGTGGSTGGGGAQGPCDIYGAANTPCVAAYSTTRALSSKYTGPLYQVRKGGQRTGSGGTTQDIAQVAGFADGAAQDSFCGSETCTVSKLYDQSGKGNDLVVAKKGCYTGTASEDDYESNAKTASITISGHKVYALYMLAHEGYRNNNGSGIPTGTASQGVYEVADGTRIGGACCWNFGNASKDNCYGPTGSMNALYFGTGYWGKGAGNGPWFMGDFEAGVWSGGSGASGTTNPNSPSMTMKYAFGILKTSTSGTPQYAIRTANAQSGSLNTNYDGQAPANWQMKGGIILGIGGDNSNSSQGTFYEGAMTAGRPTDATDAAVLQNVQAAGYGK